MTIRISKESGEQTANFETSVVNAVLLALLERKSITQWQYEQCNNSKERRTL